ncbi:MAG: CHRD domain-containing protein [Gloeobacterales cyanobacterium]
MNRISVITMAGILILASPVLAEGMTKFTASATGTQEVPRPGDQKGSASATFTLNPEKEEVCYEIQAKDITSVTMAHIHSGAAGVAGPVVINLTAPAEGSSKGCAPVSPRLIQQISQNPENFYFNVHTTEFPKGAVRGQLMKSEMAAPMKPSY